MICLSCGKDFEPPHPKRQLCSRECQLRRMSQKAAEAHAREMADPVKRAEREAYRREYRRRPAVRARLNARRRDRTATEPGYREHRNALRNRSHHRQRDRGVLQVVIGTSTEYERLYAGQGGVCAICRRPETAKDPSGRTKRLAVDHDHATGATRGLLCSRCNAGIGQMGDDPAIVRAAAEYLEGHLTEQHKRAAVARLVEVAG